MPGTPDCIVEYHFMTTVYKNCLCIKILCLFFLFFRKNVQSKGGLSVEEYIKWADAFVLMFSTTDACSFTECTRLRFLISCAKKNKSSHSRGSCYNKEPVTILVGNKKDLQHDRMVAYTDAMAKCKEIACSEYFEISVKESVEESCSVFSQLFRMHKLGFDHTISSDDVQSSPEIQRIRRYRRHGVSETHTGGGIGNKETKRKSHRSIIKKVIPSLKQRSFSDEN